MDVKLNDQEIIESGLQRWTSARPGLCAACECLGRGAWLEESLHDSTQICRRPGPAARTRCPGP